jgi:hypothetical protein
LVEAVFDFRPDRRVVFCRFLLQNASSPIDRRRVCHRDFNHCAPRSTYRLHTHQLFTVDTFITSHQ